MEGLYICADAYFEKQTFDSNLERLGKSCVLFMSVAWLREDVP
jgi:hypothetical protein